MLALAERMRALPWQADLREDRRARPRAGGTSARRRPHGNVLRLCSAGAGSHLLDVL